MAVTEKGGSRFCLLTNEGEALQSSTLVFTAVSTFVKVERWHPWSGEMHIQGARLVQEDRPCVSHPLLHVVPGKDVLTGTGDERLRLHVPFQLNRRESVLFRLFTDSVLKDSEWNCPEKEVQRVKEMDLSTGWTAWDELSGKVWNLNRLCPWEAFPGLAEDALTLTYEKRFHCEKISESQYELDFGEVGELVRLRMNGRDAGSCLWAPYRFDVTDALVGGENVITATITNSMAHRYDREALQNKVKELSRLHSGLLGPVSLWRRP